MVKNLDFSLKTVLTTAFFLGLVTTIPPHDLIAQSTQGTSTAAPAQAPPTPSTPATKPAATGTAAPFRNQPPRVSNRAAAYYESEWGIEAPSVKVAESGVILRFSFRVVDPEKAKTLNDKKLDPYLISPEKGIKLVIPTLEKVGQLRQTSTPEAGKSYWMAFSNSGRLIKHGDRVDVVIGNFHAEGLIVE